jgi:hypothetical protein
MSGHWMDGADEPLRAALARNGEIARGLAGMAEPPIHAQESACSACRLREVGMPAPGYTHTHVAGITAFKVVESEREPDCRELAAGLATAARGE